MGAAMTNLARKQLFFGRQVKRQRKTSCAQKAFKAVRGTVDTLLSQILWLEHSIDKEIGISLNTPILAPGTASLKSE